MGQIKGPAQKLADFMVKMSLEHYGSEWTMGLEYELWNEVNGNQDLLTDKQVGELKDLTEWTRGWVSMKYDSSGDRLEFLLLDDRKKKFKEN